MKHFILPVSILALLMGGCRKEEESISAPVYGRVLHINSNTPVPNALVRIWDYQSEDGSFLGGTDVLVATDTTDENGVFTIPAGLTPQSARAYGLLSQYTTESEEVQITPDHINGEKILYLYLIPKGWVSVTAVDVEPLNPEVESVLIDYTPMQVNVTYIPFSGTPIISEINGNLPYDQYYRLKNFGESQGPLQIMHDIPTRENDTTDVVIHY